MPPPPAEAVASSDGSGAAGPDPRRRRRWTIPAAIAIAVAVLLALIAGVGLAWHFSSVVLVPDHKDWRTAVDVEAVSPNRIVLGSSDEADRPGVYGLAWPGGHAIVGSVLRRGKDDVTRRLRDVHGYLVPGTDDAGIESDVYTGDPGRALGVPFRSVDVHGALGPMPAWQVPPAVPTHPRRPATWAIVVHGFNGTPQEGLRVLPVLRAAGLTTLMITYRGDLGAPDSYHHLGMTEWEDLDAAARFALRHGARRLVLVGYSMGGTIVDQFMQRSDLAPRVSGLVLDAPALDWRKIFDLNATNTGFPTAAVLPLEWAIDARIDVDWDSLDALAHPDALRLPILLSHGLDDEVVPIETSNELAAELPREVTYYRVPAAGHTQSWNVAPRLYDRRLAAFLAALDPARQRKGPDRSVGP